jgi:hypothetical protein
MTFNTCKRANLPESIGLGSVNEMKNVGYYVNYILINNLI